MPIVYDDELSLGDDIPPVFRVRGTDRLLTATHNGSNLKFLVYFSDGRLDISSSESLDVVYGNTVENFRTVSERIRSLQGVSPHPTMWEHLEDD